MLGQPNQLTTAFNYYRANINPQNALTGEPTPTPPISIPVMLINGKDDFAFASTAWEDTANYCKGPYRHVEVEGVSHWIAEEAPQEVNQLLLEFLQS
jgi:pimeloyl-ACP methyl ester carboxylesterase